MRRRRKDRERRETPEEGHGHEIGIPEKGFFACYLLCSLSPTHKGHTYIGFTVNPCRRIRQHNGEITSGAWRTKKKRPWEMILCIYGFPTKVSALQFEWAWQHPKKSLAVRKAAASFKSLSGVSNKIKLAYMMLNLPAWQSLNLAVNFFSTKYTTHCAECPILPEHMKVQVCPMDELPCHMNGGQISDDNEDDWEYENGDGNGQVKEGLVNMLVNDIADYQCSIAKTDHEQPGCIEDDDLGQPRAPLTPSKDERVPVCVGDCSITGSLDTVETTEDSDPFGVIEESSKLGQSIKQQQSPTPKAADNENNDHPPSTKSTIFSPEVELINLLTSSSDCMVLSCGKKKKRKRASSVPEIIDLTKSPTFIQL